jgi:hypothetical protein
MVYVTSALGNPNGQETSNSSWVISACPKYFATEVPSTKAVHLNVKQGLKGTAFVHCLFVLYQRWAKIVTEARSGDNCCRESLIGEEEKRQILFGDDASSHDKIPSRSEPGPVS